MTQEPVDFNQLLGNGVKLNGFMELTKKLIGKGEFTMASIYSLIDEYLPKENADKIKEYTRRCDEELTVTFMTSSVFEILEQIFIIDFRIYWEKMESYFIIVHLLSHRSISRHWLTFTTLVIGVFSMFFMYLLLKYIIFL